jgi:hypothetical protein
MTVDQQKTIVATAAWEVAFYTEKGLIHTKQFNGYTFLFNSDGSLSVNSPGGMFTGTWTLQKSNSTTPDDHGHPSGPDDSKMTIRITGNSLMDQISEDWTIIRLSDTEMWLKDDNIISGQEIRFSR